MSFKGDTFLNRNFTLPCGRRKRIDITVFKGEVYIHFNDLQKDKNFTFHSSELELFFGMKKKIDKRVKKLQTCVKKVKKTRQKADSSDEGEVEEINVEKKPSKQKIKEIKHEKIEMSSEDDMDDSS